MLAEVSEKTLEYLNEMGLDVADINYEELINKTIGALRRPRVNISMNNGSFAKVTQYKYKQNSVMSLFLLVMNLKGEKNRKFDNYKLIHSITKVLLLQDMGLDFIQDPFLPVSYVNVTDEELNASGFSLYQLDFKFSYIFTKDDHEEDCGELKEIVANYYMPDHPDQGLSGDIEVSEVDGGDAFSDNFVENIDGGGAASDSPVEDIDGGRSVSTYEY